MNIDTHPERVIELASGRTYTLGQLGQLVEEQPDTPMGRFAADLISGDVERQERAQRWNRRHP